MITPRPRLALLLALTCQGVLAFTTVGRTNVKAFVPAVISFGVSTKSKSVLCVVAGGNNAEEKSMANPSTAFGTPIGDNVKDFNRFTVGFIKGVVFDTFFAGRDYARFYALETIARMPYFSYLAALHFYETIGRWRKSNYLKIHFAENCKRRNVDYCTFHLNCSKYSQLFSSGNLQGMNFIT
jgi:hypothetical protein